MLLFFVDFCACVTFNGWFVRSLLVYFSYVILKKDPFDASFKHFFLPIILLLIQDCFLYGHFGLALIYILPIVFFAMQLKSVLMATEEVIVYFLVVGVIIFDNLFFKKMLFSRPIFDGDFLFEIIANIIVTRIILLGMRGNRFLPNLFKLNSFDLKRKVWTPNR
ncbi:MAG: hypothetical protein US49_C0006G0140 [candidate division TM6 bacterium GW2011_GWF2_37_49]|nr:MAG: hypothetical protein US49_C0006G0140 [candidate division TM6 bacterium GW2011_GWF2_37_49]